MTPVHFRGVTVGAQDMVVLMPDLVFERHRVILIGTFSYHAGRPGHRQELPWPPMTVLADFNTAFIRHSVNFTGYAMGIQLDGELTSVRFFTHRSGKRHVLQRLNTMRRRIVETLKIGFTRLLPTVWTAHQREFTSWFTAFRQARWPLERLLRRCEKFLSPAHPRHAKLIADCYAIARAAEHALDQLMTTAYMITKARNVGHAMYTDAKYRLLKETGYPPDNNPKRAGDLGYQLDLFAQFFAIKALFEKHQIPFYSEEQRAEHQRLGVKYWPETALHTYDPSLTSRRVLPQMAR